MGWFRLIMLCHVFLPDPALGFGYFSVYQLFGVFSTSFDFNSRTYVCVRRKPFFLRPRGWHPLSGIPAPLKNPKLRFDAIALTPNILLPDLARS